MASAHYAGELMQAPLIGSFFSLLFYGISCVQTFFYYQTYPDDNIFLKLLVAVIWILETIQSGFTISFNNTYFIQGFGNISMLAHNSWEFVVTCQLGLVIILLVNIYFIWRIWKFSKNIGAACLLLFLSIARFVLGMATTILGLIYTTWESFGHHAQAILAVTLSLVIIQDTLMAAILTYYLYTRRTARSAQLVTRLLAYIVATGVLTSMVAMVALVCLLASPNSLLWLSIILVQVKVYVNSALLSLNQRQYLRKPRHHTEISLSEFVIAPENSKTSEQDVE